VNGRCRVERLLLFYPGTALRQFAAGGEFCRLRHHLAKERGMVADDQYSRATTA